MGYPYCNHEFLEGSSVGSFWKSLEVVRILWKSLEVVGLLWKFLEVPHGWGALVLSI